MASTPPAGGRSQTSRSHNEDSDEGERPPLPPRPTTLSPTTPTRPPLRASATTALSLPDVHGQSFPEGVRGFSAVSTPSRRSTSRGSPRPHLRSRASSDADTSSVRSFINTLPSSDVGTLLEEALGGGDQAVWSAKSLEEGVLEKSSVPPFSLEEPRQGFSSEFEDIGELDADGGNAEVLLGKWRPKLKHFHILSAAGKPVYNRHGSDNLISGEIGVIQTIISFYEGAKDQLKSFTAGGAIFVVMTRGPLYLLAISRLGESETHLRNQLEALYMQILSTLTLPRLTSMFSLRPSTDLRRPLQGTESLLSALADSFTRGSPSTLLSALECLKLRTTQRQAINAAMLKAKSKDLLYGLIVAGGRLVSVIRPRTHSLHPGDLQLIFNMLFEAGGVKAGGGDSWIPLCLPGFNKNGFLYMYVSFLEGAESGSAEGSKSPPASASPMFAQSEKADEQIAILLLSASKEAFFHMQEMRDAVVNELSRTGLLNAIYVSAATSRPLPNDVAPGTSLLHFLYKSRGNLQFIMSSFAALPVPRDERGPTSPTNAPSTAQLQQLQRRRLLTLYHRLHTSVHHHGSGAAAAGGARHLLVSHSVALDAVALAWLTPVFELYCVAEPGTSRASLSSAANAIVRWVRREEERVFIIGGAVF